MKNPLAAQLESLLFVAQKPLSLKKMCELAGAREDEVSSALDELSHMYEAEMRGIILLHNVNQYELATNPANTELILRYTKEEISGELTRAGIETLTVVAYRGPLTKSALEQVRGVNCTIVLRNLMVRGLIEVVGEGPGEKNYMLSCDFLRHLGISRVEDLPDYASLNSDERLEQIMARNETPNP